jgi:hypothetical protein
MIKQAYREEALGRSAAFKWHKCFTQWRDSLEDDTYKGRPRTIKTEPKIREVATLVHSNRSQTVDEIAKAIAIVVAAAAGISHDTCN